ncbi:MAG: PEP-CTERM sorting domain-containing protein [Tepidisphaeraceae bacterium]
MKPSKKNLSKVLSTISMAAAATIVARSAQAQIMIAPFYAQAQSGATANFTNGVFIENSAKNFGTATFESISNSTPTTINVPVGDYLFMAMDAVITGNPNPDGGKFTGATNSDSGATQPSNMGFSAISIHIESTDTHGANLQPVRGAQINGSPSYSTGFGYFSTAIVNTTMGNNTTGAYVPRWTSIESQGDVEASDGVVGAHAYIGGGNVPPDAGTASGASEIGQFGGTSASYAQATPVFTNLQYQRTGTGTVTLSPSIVVAGTAYWSLAAPGNPSTGAPSVYRAVPATVNQVGNLPVLVIQTTGLTGHAIVSLTAGDSPATGYGSQVGSTLAVIGGNGSYTAVQTNFTATATGSVEVDPWNPATDTEVFGVDVSSGSLTALVAAINSGDANVPASHVVASTSSPSPDPFGSQYNLFLTFSGSNLPGTATDTLGLDLSSTNDPLLSGYTFSAVAVAPEPMSVGLLMLGGVGLMARRNRRGGAGSGATNRSSRRCP